MNQFESPLTRLPQTEDGLISLYDISSALGISLRTVERALARGAFPGEVLKRGRGGKRFLHRSQVEAALFANRLPTPRQRTQHEQETAK